MNTEIENEKLKRYKDKTYIFRAQRRLRCGKTWSNDIYVLPYPNK
jgi:hypothetical protein